jgi:hypothetical protein
MNELRSQWLQKCFYGFVALHKNIKTQDGTQFKPNMPFENDR